MAQGLSASDLTALRINSPTIFFDDLSSFDRFINDLDYCRTHQLDSQDPLVKKCRTFWQDMLISLSSNREFLTKIAEEKYSKTDVAYGMSSKNYRYLKKILEETNHNT